MLDTYPREKHGFAMSIWSMGMILGPVAGPTVGAMLTEFYDWRYVFYMNVPFGIVAFFSILVTLPVTSYIGPENGLDWCNSAYRGGFLSSTGVRQGRAIRWFSSSEVIINSVLSATAFYIFVVHCLTTDAPYVTLKMLMDRNYVIGLFLIFTFGVAVFSSLFILPLFLQNIQGYPVLSAGWVISSRGVGTMFAMMCSGFLLSIISGKYLILLGLICVGVSNVWMTQWTADVNMQEVIYITIINGFGMGMMWVALTTVTFSTLDPVYRVEAGFHFFR